MEQAQRPIRTWRAGEIALVVLAVLATIAAAKAAQAFLVPVIVGIILAYALKPIVNGLENYKVPRPIGATVVLALVTALVLGAGGHAADKEASPPSSIDGLDRQLAELFKAGKVPGASVVR